MSLIDRWEQRTSPENPATNLADPASWLWDSLGARKSTSGQMVSERTALGLTTVYACIRVLAEGVASIPLNVYKRLPGGGKERADDHPNYELLHDRPNRDMPSFSWRETIMAHLALRGNAFNEKEYNRRGELTALWPIRPDRVSVERIGGRKVFKITTNGKQEEYTSAEIMHIPGLGYDGLVGYSPITIASDAIGLGLAAQEHGARFFDNGAEIGGILEHPGRLTDMAAKHLRESFEAKHRGTGNAHRTLIAEEGMTWKAVGLSNRDSQYLETRKFQVSEIARIYRVPPHMIGDLDRATFSNIEQQSIDFVVHTLRPWLVLLEQVLNWELFGDVKRSQFFCEFNVDGLLRGDSAARSTFYKELAAIGVFSINDIRDKENMNPVDGGDIRLVPLNMQTLAKANAPTPDPVPVVDPAADPTPPIAPRFRDACYRLYRQAADRCLAKYVKAARRAVVKTQGKPDEWQRWVAEFFAAERLSARMTFQPPTLALVDLAGQDAKDWLAYADAVSQRLTDGLAHELLTVAPEQRLACVDGWEATRADQIATHETTTVVALLTSGARNHPPPTTADALMAVATALAERKASVINVAAPQVTLPPITVSPPSVQIAGATVHVAPSPVHLTLEAPKSGTRKTGTVRRNDDGSTSVELTDVTS